MPNKPIKDFTEHTGAIANTDYVPVSINGKTRKTLYSNFKNFVGGDQTGVIDSTNALLAGFNRGGLVQMQSGIYKVSGSDIPIPAGIQWEGLGDVTIDMTTADPSEAFMLAEGSLTLLPAISANILFGSRSITFDSPPAVNIGDIIVIQDQTDFSYSVYRSYYKKGEYLTVLSVSGNTITTTSAIYDAYTTGANLKAWKMNPVTVGIRNIKFRFKTGVDIPGIKIKHGRNCQLEWLDLQGSRHAQLYMDRCYGMALSRIYTRDYNAAAGLNYGFLGNGQRYSLTNCDLSATRHGGDFGGEDQDGSVINREITISGGIMSSTGGDTGFKFHGNSEHCSVLGVALPNGLTLGGDYFTVKGCPIIGNDNNLTYCIADGENVGLNYEIVGNILRASRNHSEGIVSLSVRAGTRNKSVMKFSNKVILGTFGHPDYPDVAGSPRPTYGVQVAVVGTPLTDDITLIFGGEYSTEETVVGEVYGIYVNPSAAAGFKRVILDDPILDKCGIRIRPNIGRGVGSFKSHDALDAGLDMPIRLSPSITDQFYNFWNVDIVGAQKTGIRAVMQNGARGQIRFSTIYNCAQTPVGSALDTSIYWNGGVMLELLNNTLGDTSASPTSTELFVVDGTDELFNEGNVNIGENVNSLEPSITGVTTDWTGIKKLVNGDLVHWNLVSRAVGIGAAASTSSLVPLLARRDENGAVVLEIQNQLALGNVNASAGFLARDKDCSGEFRATRSDHTNSQLRKRLSVLPNSNADNGIALYAVVAGQKVDIYSGSTTKTAEFNQSVVAGETRFKLFDVDSGLLQTCKVGANGTGPGGVGRAIFIDNV